MGIAVLREAAIVLNPGHVGAKKAGRHLFRHHSGYNQGSVATRPGASVSQSLIRVEFGFILADARGIEKQPKVAVTD